MEGRQTDNYWKLFLLADNTRLRDELEDAMDRTGLAGVDKPMSLTEAIDALKAWVVGLEEENKRLNDLCKDTNDELLDERLKWDRAHGKGKYPQVPVTPIDDAEEPEDDRPERQQYP
jgi:hypothetical protein